MKKRDSDESGTRRRRTTAASTIRDPSREGVREPSGLTQRERPLKAARSDVPLIEAHNVKHGDDLGTEVDADVFDAATTAGDINWRAPVLVAIAHLKGATAQLSEVQSPRVQVANADVELALRVLSELLGRARDE